MYGASGMGVQRAAWHELFGAEAAVVSKLHYAASLLDLTKAFEFVCHKLLVDEARGNDYSLCVVRLSLAAYKIARAIGVGGVYSALVFALRGITAGSGFATTELRVLLTRVAFEISRTPSMGLKVYVDDMTLSSTDRYPHRLAWRMAITLDKLVTRLTQLKLIVSCGKR